MNKKIVLVTIVLSLVFSLFLYFNYTKANEKTEINLEKIYFIQVAAFSKYENVTKLSKTLNSYLVIKEKDLYHIYVAATASLKNSEKLKEFYRKRGNNIYIKEIKTSDKEFLKYIKKYDYFLSETNDKDVILSISKDILKKYEELIK